jgi:hypothetical protein
LAPFVFDILALRLSAKFLLRAFYIGTIELNSGIKRPSTRASSVAKKVGAGLTLIPG